MIWVVVLRIWGGFEESLSFRPKCSIEIQVPFFPKVGAGLLDLGSSSGGLGQDMDTVGGGVDPAVGSGESLRSTKARKVRFHLGHGTGQGPWTREERIRASVIRRHHERESGMIQILRRRH